MIEINQIIKALKKANEIEEKDEMLLYTKNEVELLKINREQFTTRILDVLKIDKTCKMCKYYNQTGKVCRCWNIGEVEDDQKACNSFILKEG